MAEIPPHDCPLPRPQKTADGQSYVLGADGRRWTCPTCGQRWHWTVRHAAMGKVEGWQRSHSFTLPGLGVAANLREAYELEQLAMAAPWWAVLGKAQARRRARTLRRLEGQT